jgi:GNAT superfamily N-acetyltransferase
MAPGGEATPVVHDPLEVIVCQANPADVELVASILREAADWLIAQGKPLWLEHELLPADIEAHVRAGFFFIAWREGRPAGTFRLELTDPDTWPDVEPDESVFVHRFAVCRRFAGGGVSRAMLGWAEEYARAHRRRYLRLDCDAARHKLRDLYSECGFTHHSDRQVGPFFLARYERVLTPEPRTPRKPLATSSADRSEPGRE